MSFWLVVEKKNVVYRLGRLEDWNRDWFVRRLNRNGHRLGGDVGLTRLEGLRGLSWVSPIGMNRDGNLVLDCGIGRMTPKNRLVLVTPRGVKGVSQFLEPFSPEYAFTDGKGNVHIFPAQRFGYFWVESRTGRFQVRRNFDYSEIFGGVRNVPSHLDWSASSGRFAFLPEGKNQVVVAVVQSPEDSVISVYRIDDTSLALLDSSRVRVGLDASYAYKDVVLERMRFVSAEKGGYWLFTPGPTEKRAFPKPYEQSSQVLVYRLNSNLEVIRPERVTTAELLPFSQVTREVLTIVQCEFIPDRKPQYLEDAYRATVGQRLEFIGFSGDGRLFYTSEEDYLNLHILGSTEEQRR